MNYKFALTVLFVACCSGLTQAEDVRFPLLNGGSVVVDVAGVVEVTIREQGVNRSYTGRIENLKTKAGKPDGQYFMLHGDFGRKLVMIRDVAGIVSLEQSAASTDKDPLLSERSSGSEQDPPKQVVLYLPLEGGVGEQFRHQEIERIGELADELSPSGDAIIVLKINSNGGLVAESLQINDRIRDIKSRGHRVVGWIRKAISAGCSTAMACDEIIFNPLGTAGSVTTVQGSRSIDEEEDPEVKKHLEETALEAGYSVHVARSMKLNRWMTAYWVDPETEKVEWFGGVDGVWNESLPEGAVVLSNENQNLSFNASNALACGFSRATCINLDEVAEYLELPDGEWYVTDDLGEKIAKRWADTYAECTERLQLSIREWQFKGSADGGAGVLKSRIQILREWKRWLKKAPLLVSMERNILGILYEEGVFLGATEQADFMDLELLEKGLDRLIKKYSLQLRNAR